jgi:tRNA G10  N-methylase Trm11
LILRDPDLAKVLEKEAFTVDPFKRDPHVLAERWTGCYESSRGDIFTKESNRHPAKMAVGLCYRIFQHGEEMGYWKKGDVILDPMAGIGTTLVVGATLGYRTIGVELERHFVELCEQNIQFSENFWHTMGFAVVIQGDARFLPECVLSPELTNGLVTSPPYADMGMASAICGKARKLYRDGKVDEALAVLREQEEKEIAAGWTRSPRSEEFLLTQLKNDAEWANGYSGAVSSPPYADSDLTVGGHFRSRREPEAAAVSSNDHAGYSGIDSEKEKKLSGVNAQHKIPQRYDGVVNSPPFLMPAGGGKGIAKTGHRFDPGLANRQYVPEQFSKNGAQIGNLKDPKGDIDAVLSSPPYQDQMSAARARGRGPTGDKLIAQKKIEHNKMGDGPDQIGNLHSKDGDLDAVLSSPPYATRMDGGGIAKKGQFKPYTNEPSDTWHTQRNPANIGNLMDEKHRDGRESYLSAMLKVYEQMYAVLKPAGVVALVTKNPVKDKQIRRLDLDTIALMEHAGFLLIEHKCAMLCDEVQHGHLFGGDEIKRRQRKSFFKRLYEKKFPELAVDFEDVTFYRKV